MTRSDEQLDRNWNELLQELRVTQTGAQVLTGFLLTLPFTPKFGDLEHYQMSIYLATFVGSVATTGLLIAPVAFHRLLFRQGQKPWLVRAADVTAKLGLLLLAITTSAVMVLVFDVVVSWHTAQIAGAVTLSALLLLWVGTPAVAHWNNPGGEPTPSS